MAQNDNALTKSNVKAYMKDPGVRKRTEELLGRRADQFITSITSMINADDNLAKCEPTSLFMACLTAAALDLPVNKNLGFAHIVPYQNNKAGVTEAQFQLGWKGLVQLAQRSGQYKTIAATPVYEGQVATQDPLAGNTYAWDQQSSDKVIGYVAKIVLVNGFEKELFMTADDVTKHAKKYSKAYAYDLAKGYTKSPWSSNFEAMALKTVVKLLISKWGPMSVDTQMQKAVEADQGVIHEDGSVDYIDGEAVDGADTSEEATRARIVAAEAKRKEMDGNGHVAKKVETTEPEQK
jgi:recombination protein RecT